MKKLVIILVFIGIAVISCAKKGTPSGGEKDTEPPVMVKAEPDNYSTNFSGQEIKIYFNEYIKLKDLTKQLIISPPLKFRPIITPQGGASRFVKIKILDTLSPNTTYSFNFGKSVVDNNEGNPYPFFKYILSTGSTIDSLTLKGSVKDALERKTDNFVSVMLYEVDSTFTDSTIYLKTPKYITNTLDSATTFQFENLKAGTYQLIALKEESDNYIFNQKSDKIGFIKEHITLPTEASYELTLFKEIENYKAKKPKHKKKNRIRFRYEGPYNDDISIKLITEKKPENFKSLITKDVETDTLNYWFSPNFDQDSLNFIMTHKQSIDTFKVRLRKKIKQDSLFFKPKSAVLTSNDVYKIQPSIPISKIDTSKISVMNKDSVFLPFKVSKEKFVNTISIDFKKVEEQRYYIKALPEAFTDFFGKINDSLSYTASSKAASNYGNMRLTINNIPKTPIIVQLTTEKGDVKYEQFAQGKKVFDFFNIDPSTYYLRVIFDDNNNKKYDTGNFLTKQQPERVSYYPEGVEVRANWDIDQQFTLK